MENLSKEAPAKSREAFATIVELTDSFCRQHLGEDYQQLARKRSRIDINQGRPKSWASGIVHALGWVNFLQDTGFEPYMSSPDLAKGFDVSQGTMTGKSKIIRDVLDIMPMDPRWCLPELLERNPLVWMLEVNGFIMDIRSAPRDLQQAAYEQGVIPYIPADRQKTAPEIDKEAKNLKFSGPQNNSAEEPQPEEPPDDNQPTLF